MTSFPKGWFFIKNLNSGYVLSSEKSTVGEPVSMTTIKSKDVDSQLWQHGEDGRLHNKKTGFVLDVSKGSAKVGAEIVQQHDSDSSSCQTFGLSPDGHIYLTKDSGLVLGIKESFFTRRDGQHVHLQKLNKNVKEGKEQRWEFMAATQKRTSILSGSMNSLKRTISGASLGSFSSTSLHHHDGDEDTCLDESNQLTSFPDHEFFIKSESTGYFIGVEFASANSSGARIFLSPLRKSDYETQLWHYDALTGRLVNKFSGFALTADEVMDEANIRQSSNITEKDLNLQSWIFANSGEIRLKSDHHYVLGFKKDNWFGLNRDSAALMLQKQTDHRTHSYQRFVIVAPVFKKKTTEITTVTEQIGVFPEGHFFIKNQKHGLVITVFETDKLAAQIVATKLDPKNFNRQLWSHKDGFLINKESNLVLDVRGGCIEDGSELCQYKQKKEGFENQQWGLSPEGYIHSKNHKDVVIAVSSTNKKDHLPVRLADRKTPDHSEQRWNFVLPVFKQVSASVPETTVQKKVHYHNYAQYPSGWFFIRSFAYASPESPLVLTADSVTEQIHLQQISKENWRNQLWMYWNGVLINFATQLAIDVENDNLVAGSSIRQELRKAGDIGQRWRLTIEGYLIHGSNPSLTLVPQKVSESESYNLVLAEYLSVQQEHRWSLLSPEIKVENNTQVLVRWTVSVLTEWKQFNEQAVQKVVHRIANWPEDTFFITAQGSLALVPEKPESFAFLTVKKLELGESSEHFKWTFRNGYLTHVATGLVLHAADDLVGGSQLQIRNELVTESNTIDARQSWAVMTDGSIVSQSKKNLGFTLIQQDSKYQVQLAYAGNSYEHYAWGFARGHYETRYSDIYKKEVRYVSRTERILLTVCTHKTSSNHNTKLVTHSYGVFPDSWFYICSKADKSLVLTAPSKKEGDKLILQKMDYKIFRRQLWHVQDDGCLINLESDFVVDVAGGAIENGSNIIQWHQKFLKRHRKNQIWALSVDGHIHPKNRPNYVLSVKDRNVAEGSDIQLHVRGSLDLEYQRWTFAVPRFGKTVNGVKGVAVAPGILERNGSGLFVEHTDEASVETSTTERYESVEKYSVVRRWGIFPEGGFFIRANYGDERLALTVEQKARVGDNSSTEHEVTLRPINFKKYKWHFWTYENGYLINAQTGLALDATVVKGVLTEEGLRNPLFVREKSMSEYQFWSLTANGEIYLRCDERLVIGVSNSSRIQAPGAQVGLRQLSVRKFINEKGQRETALKSEQWLRWMFSKPVYRTTTITTTTSTEDTSNTSEIQGLDDHTLDVKESEESAEEVDSESDDSESEDEGEDSGSLSELNVAESTGIVTTGTSLLNSAKDAATKVSETLTSAPEAISNVLRNSKDDSKSNKTNQLDKKKKTTYSSLKFDRKESFRVEYDYVPTGFEKIVRYKTHNLQNFPVSGYFFIKSYLHGMVLDVVNGDTRDGAYVVLAPMKSTNFASQLWSYREGRVVNLKGHNLVLDASMTDTIVAGERLVISTRITGENVADQQWELGTDGLISLKSNPTLVLGVKELKRVSSQDTTIDVYLQEEKTHLAGNIGRPEQHWEIKIPALVPVEQTNGGALTDRFTIIEAGRISAISSCISVIAAFSCLKQTFQHRITADNQWPSSQNWFLISADNGNAFLSSGITDSTEVSFVKLGEQEDHKQYLWTYINGYLINYKHMLRLIYDKNSHKLMLSGNHETLHQTFCITRKSTLYVKIHSETIFFNVAYSSHNERRYQLITTDHEITENKSTLHLHIPVFSNSEIEKESKVALSTVIAWVMNSQKTSTSSSVTTITTNTVQKYGLFPRATWFFIKVDTKKADSLVLAVNDSSTGQGSFLSLKKLSFKDYRNQLWTYRSGVLINYGSKLVIDVDGDIHESAKLIQATESGVSSQKWSLTADGRIYLDSYAQYTLGFVGIEELTEDTHLQLVSEGNSDSHSIMWKFSVPIFGKTTTTGSEANVTIVNNASSIERLAASIEANALIESIEEADIEVEDISVKKNNALNTKMPSSVVVVDDEKHHSFQDILTNVGIAATSTVAAVGVVKGASTLADKISQHNQKRTEEKEQASDSSVAIQESVDQKAASSVSSDKKATEKITVRRSKQTSVQIIEESRMITRAWKITFGQRIRRCKTREELIETIEECREDLFRRLDEHLRVHASVEHLVVGSVPDWHVSVHQIKELYRARVFEKFLGRLQSNEATDLSGLDFDSTIATASQEAENHYQLVIENETKKTSSVQNKLSDSAEAVSSTEDILVTVDSIKVTVRYWLISMYEAVHKAKIDGSSEEEINSIFENSRKELSHELTQIKNDVSERFKQSSTTLSSKQTSIIKTVEAAISQTESVMTSVCAQKQYLVDEEHWLDVTRIIEEHLSSELQVYQAAVTQDVVDVQTAEIKDTDKAEISVVLDEKMVGVAQQTVVNKLLETQTKLSSWFIQTTQQIELLIEEGNDSSDQVIKQDTLAIIDAAQVEINTHIEEAKLVLRAYYAHLTYLSWAERRRVEYSLENIKASITASINKFKKSIVSQEVSKQQIVRYSSYSFGANASRIVLSDLQSIVTKITNVKKTTSVVNKTQEIEGENNKLAIVGDNNSTKITEVKKTTEITETTQSAQESVAKKTQVTKTDDTKQVEKSKPNQGTKVVDTTETEVEQTKVGKVSNKPSSSSTVLEGQKKVSDNKTNTASSAVLGAAAAALASAAIFHHHDAKENEQQGSSDVAKDTNTISNSIEEKTSAEATKTQTTIEKKSDTLVVVYDEVHVMIKNWLVELNKKVYECAQTKVENVHQEIDNIIFESQQKLAIEIEKSKRSTTSIIGTSQTSFHNTLSWVRSAIWKQTYEIKQIGYEIATTTETDYTRFEQKLESVKENALQKVDSVLEKAKLSASVVHKVGHESSATIAAGKKFEGIDYSKSKYGESVEKSKVVVGILIEDTRLVIENAFRKLSKAVIERRKQGGDDLEANINVIVKNSHEEISTYILKSKTEFEKRIQASSKSSKIDTELQTETIKKVQATLEQVLTSVSLQISKVEKIATSTVTDDAEYDELLNSITHETCEKVDSTLAVSETIIGHHIEVTAESVSTHQSVVDEETSSSKMSLGVQYGLVIVAETTKNVSSHISALVERVHQLLTVGSESFEEDVHGLVVVSEKELDLVLDEAKNKITYELSMVSAQEKAEEKHFLESLEAIRQSTRTRIAQVNKIATSGKEEAKNTSEKLLQITEESRHEIKSHLESVKHAVTMKAEKVVESIKDTTSSIVPHVQESIGETHQQKDKEDDHSKAELAKKMLKGTASVAVGTAIAVEIGKKLSEHKKKEEQTKEQQKQAVAVIDDVKLQFSKWLSTLTDTIVSQTKRSTISTEEITTTVEKSKTEFLEIIKTAKSNQVVVEKHQHDVLSWIENTASAQATRIQEIAVASSTSAAIDVKSRLEVIKLSTTQEVELALEKCKQVKSSASGFVGISIDKLKQKEAALLDIQSELTMVTESVQSALTVYFLKFTKSVISRLEQGGDNVEKDLALLIGTARKEVASLTEEVKNSAIKRLSALETKSTLSVVSTATLSGVATAEAIKMIKSSEDLIMQRINRVHSSVWYIEKDQDITKITESISTITKETVADITKKFESSKHEFVCSINDHHSCGHITADVAEHTEQSSTILTASLSIHEVKITIREWLKSLTEKVSTCSQNGKSSDEIEAVVMKENDSIYSYLDQSVVKIKETLKTEESIKSFDLVIEQVKTTITKASTEIKTIGIESSTSSSHNYGGFDKMTSVVIEHEHVISQTLVDYENKISSKTIEQKKQQVTDSSQTKQQQKAGKDIYKVIATEYTLSIVHNWFEELMLDVSECAKHEHDVTAVSKDINTVISEAKEYINAELNSIIKKIQTAKADSSAKLELINTIEWTRGMVIQSSSQVQTIGVNSAVAYSSTGGMEQMKPLVTATENQVNVTFSRCNKTLEIEVESNSAHYERKKAKSECIKQEIKKKADCVNQKKKKESKLIKKAKESKSDSESSNDDADDKKKTQKTKKKTDYKKSAKDLSEDDTSSSEDESKKKKKSSCIDKKKIVAGIVAGGAIVKHALDQSSSDSDNDSETEKQTTIVDKKKLKTGQSTLDITIIVKEWYDRLIVDVSTRAKQGGSNVNVDIEVIVQNAVAKITETLRIINVNAHKSVVGATTVQQYQNSVEWVKNLVIQSSYQIKAIGINCAAAGSKTGGIEQMRPIAVSIQEQITVEIRRYKLVVEKSESEAKKDTQITKIEHKENEDKVQFGRISACNRNEYCDKLEKHVNSMINESKVTFSSWFSELIREVSICIHQGGDNVEEDVKTLVEKSKLELESTIKRIQTKFTSSIETSEKDKTTLLIKSHFHESLQAVESTTTNKLAEIHRIVAERRSKTESSEKLMTILQSFKVTINESLDNSHNQSITIINQELTQTESTVKVIDTVEEIKSVISQWHSKLSEEIHSISIDASIENKEERIHTLIEQATLEIERITKEAKTKVTENCNSVKKISKSKEQELLLAIDRAHETFNTDVKKIQEVSIEAIKKSDTNVKDTISSVVETSKEKIDSALTKTAAAVIGTATAAMAVHAIKKDNKAEEKKTETKHNELSVGVDQNVSVISQWLELFVKNVTNSIRLKQESAIEEVTHITDHAEQEITEIISIARNDFIKRLSHQNLDQEAYDFACKHYEESLESVRVTIVTEIVEVKKAAIHAHSTGNIQEFEAHVIKLNDTSNQRIKAAMGSSVVLKQKVNNTSSLSKSSDAHVQIEFDEDDVLIGEEELEFERKESIVDTHKEEKNDKVKTEQVKDKKKDANTDKIVSGTLAAGAAVLINKKNEELEKQKVKQDIISTHQHLKYDSGVTTIESVNILISAWFTLLIQKVSTASKSGASSKKITTIVEESRAELVRIVEHAKSYGSKYCATANDEQQYISKIEWAASVAHNQATQIQQIGINASASKSDLTKQMEASATASYHQIEITLEQMKTSVKFHQKINKINSNKTQSVNIEAGSTVAATDKPVCGKMETTVDKTKLAYTVIQETRVTTVSIFVSLHERIVYRIRQGGSNLQEDVYNMIEASEQELLKVFSEAKIASSKVDKKTRSEIEEALSSVQKTVQEQISEIKTVSVEAVSITTTDSKLAVEKVLECSKQSKGKIENAFTTVSESITASLIVVGKTAKEATETVQGWFVSLRHKITEVLEASDCSEQEKQTKVTTLVSEAEAEMKTKIEKLQQTAAQTQKTSSATTEVTANHHLDIFLNNVKFSAQNQLNAVKTAVENTSQIDKSKIVSALEKGEKKLKQEVGIHCEAVEKIANVSHITGSQQKVATEVEKKDRHDSYKNTIEKAAIGAVAVAAAAAIAIDHHKKNQQSKTAKVQIVKEHSLKDVQTTIDRWFIQLTDRVTAVTKKGGNNVSVEVNQIIKEAQSELELIINEFKSQHTTSVAESTESKRTFVQTLEWIKTTTFAQTNQIVETVSHSSSSSIDLSAQIQNYVSATKHQVNTALEVHFENTANSDVKVDKSKSSSHEQSKSTENTVQIVKENCQQTQKRFQLEATVIVQESKTKVTNWLVLLLSDITNIIHGNSETIRKDILTKLDTAEREIDVMIKEIKDQFLATSKTGATSHVETDTQTLIINSVKQTLDCVDSVRTVLSLQLSVVREVITRIEVEDIDVITERLEAIINRTQTRISHTLEHGVELAISSAFEGKIVTWSETATIPASFKGVRAIAFDLMGTVANYHKSLYEEWKKIVASKQDAVLSSLQFNNFANDWYEAYSEAKRNSFIHKQFVNDEGCLHETLVKVLQHYYIKDSFDDSEIEQLCLAWRNVGVHEDVSFGIRRLKNQSPAKYATVAISDTFSTGTMVKLAQNNCLCWHAQFSAEMFANSSEVSASESVVKGTIQLLGLSHANELAVVSSDCHLVAAAKAQGCHAVFVEREGHSSHSEQRESVQYDIKVDGLDVFGESVQSFWEHESMTKVWSEKQAPSAPRVWVPKIKGIFRQ